MTTARGPSLDSSLKAREVEEVIDLCFYRPLGFAIARVLSRTHVRPNHVTVASIVLGVAAGHLLYYPHLGLTVAGILAFGLANLLDSVDGQLARMKNLQSRLGRILDGVAGGCIFASIYLHLALRQYAAGDGVLVLLLAAVALYSQAVQNSIADCFLNAYLTFGLGKAGSELDDANEMGQRSRQSANPLQRWGLWFYAGYMATQERLTPALQHFRRTMGAHLFSDPGAQISAAYRRMNLPIVHQRAWIATNIRMFIVFLAVLTDRVVWYFWFNIVGLNLVMAVLVIRHERNCRSLTVAAGADAPVKEG